jgi:pSer/pThr/pTyr-binding forkhead associated (FHA) protein
LSAPARLVWRRTGAEPVEFPLEAEVLEIGRGEESAIRIDEPLVSRHHARLERRGETWVLCDLDSTNFTRVNGQRIRREMELSDGDELRFARAVCVFHQPVPKESTAPSRRAETA